MVYSDLPESTLGTCSGIATIFRSNASQLRVFLYGDYRDVMFYSSVAMLKTLKCPVRVVWVFRKTQWIALFSTDLDLSIKQIIEYYGARWKIEAGFKEIKQEIGSSKSQTRNAHAVINHINFSLMAAAIIWIYGVRLENIPERQSFFTINIKYNHNSWTITVFHGMMNSRIKKENS